MNEEEQFQPTTTTTNKNDNDDTTIIIIQEHITKGDCAYVEEQYDIACQHYTDALLLYNNINTTTTTTTSTNQKMDNSTSTSSSSTTHELLYLKCLLHRSLSYIQKQEYDIAMKDIQVVINRIEKNDTTTQYQMLDDKLLLLCYRTYGIILYQQQFYNDAIQAFHKAIQILQNNNNNHHHSSSTNNIQLQQQSKSKYNTISYYEDYILQCQQQQQQQQQNQTITEPMETEIFETIQPTSSKGQENVTATTTTTTSDINQHTIRTMNTRKSTNDDNGSSHHSGNTSTTTSTPTTSTPTSTTTTTITKLNPATILALTPKYQYYQNDHYMIIQVLESNVISSNLHVDYIDEQHISISLLKQNHTFYIIQNGELYDTIIPKQCTISYKTDKVIIKLRKERSNYEWQSLLSEKTIATTKKKKSLPSSTPITTTNTPTAETSTTITTDSIPPDVVVNESSQMAVPAVTTSTTTTKPTPNTKIPKPYASHRDWDAIEKDIEQEILSEQPIGDAAMNQLFQQIYANANDDTKRAMIKSYQTSGGTVLSTNWNEVAQKDYEKERIAPNGQEWKTWEGNKLSK